MIWFIIVKMSSRTLLLLLLFGFLFACAPTQHQQSEPSRTTSVFEGVEEVVTISSFGSPTSTILESNKPTRTAIPVPVRENTSQPLKTPTSTPILTPTHGLVARICSPLEGFARKEILEIVSNPFVLPQPGRDDGHHGIDFAYYRREGKPTLEGTAVQVIFSGRVAAVIRDSIPYGNLVIVETLYEYLPGKVISIWGIDSDLSVYHLYAHMKDDLRVKLNETLFCGQTVGVVGNSGWSGNPHLHLETRIGPAGISFENMAYYHTKTTEQERENYQRWRFGGEFHPVDPMLLLNSEDNR